jgi:hypothetical protein
MISIPKTIRISARTSSVTNAFTNSIIPVFKPSEKEREEALSILGISKDDIRCAYCGDHATEWDHLRPLVRNQRPTGYVTEIANLVPACGKCNQSKSGRDWREWIRGSARQSPTTRKIADLENRVKRLEAFDHWRKPLEVDFENAVGADLWTKHWRNHKNLLKEMRRCQKLAEEIRQTVVRRYRADHVK